MGQDGLIDAVDDGGLKSWKRSRGVVTNLPFPRAHGPPDVSS